MFGKHKNSMSQMSPEINFDSDLPQEPKKQVEKKGKNSVRGKKSMTPFVATQWPVQVKVGTIEIQGPIIQLRTFTNDIIAKMVTHQCKNKTFQTL